MCTCCCLVLLFVTFFRLLLGFPICRYFSICLGFLRFELEGGALHCMFGVWGFELSLFVCFGVECLLFIDEDSYCGLCGPCFFAQIDLFIDLIFLLL